MRYGWAVLALTTGAVAGTAMAEWSPIQALAGRYSRHFTNGLLSGERYGGDDVVEIVPVDPGRAYVRLSLQFYNGRSCSLYGVARMERDELVYRDPAGGASPCTLSLRRDYARLTWTDSRTCSAFCGARGSLADGALPIASRRPIGYMTRLTTSREYGEAMRAWRSGGSR